MQQQPAPQLLLKGQAANDIIDVLRRVAATLSRHSGGTFGVWPWLPTGTGSTGFYGGA